MTHEQSGPRGMGSILMGFFIGGMVGAVAALLMAPQSGERTRAMIRDKGIELREKAMETRERAEESLRGAMNRTEEMAQTAKERMEEMTRRGKKEMEEQSGPMNM